MPCTKAKVEGGVFAGHLFSQGTASWNKSHRTCEEGLRGYLTQLKVRRENSWMLDTSYYQCGH